MEQADIDFEIKEATGCTVTEKQLRKSKRYVITDFGAAEDKSPADNARAINEAIRAANENGGGTVVVPSGEYRVYTIRLMSDVNLYLEKGAVLRAGRCDITSGYELQEGEGGNYDEPEVNLYAGLQDHGHTYFANSLVYGADLENVMICGEGLFDGSYVDENGYTRYALLGGDPAGSDRRNEKGHKGTWFGNKGIALVRCNNVVLKDFSIVDCGHFAIITEGVRNMLVDSILVDTIRDAFDVDACQDVTVVNSKFNSLTDDALVLKASYGAGLFMPLKNVYIENCEVMGYDAGSAYSGRYTCDKLVAEDNEGPTGRVKLGTESTCGYERVTVRNVKFERSRGFALEAVDGSDLCDIIFEDCVLDNISSSPVFIKVGDRGRFPVTGNSDTEEVSPSGNVRLDNVGWILPDKEEYTKYPAKRYTPSYNFTKRVTADGNNYFNVVDDKNPAVLNPNNYFESDGKYYRMKYTSCGYAPDFSSEIEEKDIFAYANAVGSDHVAKIRNIYINNIKVTNADPRYPMIIMGLESGHVENVFMSNVDVEYRGGMKMEMAVEQRQLNTNWEYSQFGSPNKIQRLPWLVNTFFLKNEGLLPRLDWNRESECFKASPYNVPELPWVYPEPANWGILPAYGLYARHVDGLKLSNVNVRFIIEDERPAFVFDDVNDGVVSGCSADTKEDVPTYVFVRNNYKRPTNSEYIPETPYHSTDCSVILESVDSQEVMHVLVDAPSPGTPSDSLYPYPTCPCSENGYEYDIPTDEYELPRTVYRPYFCPIDDVCVAPGQVVCFEVEVRNPATDGTDKLEKDGKYGEEAVQTDYIVSPKSGFIILSCINLPEGASFDGSSGNFIWTPEEKGEYRITFVADDGVIPVYKTVTILCK